VKGSWAWRCRLPEYNTMHNKLMASLVDLKLGTSTSWKHQWHHLSI
jgi:hypothetical protein